MTDDAEIGKLVRLAILRAEHNTLAAVEEFCTGKASKLKRYAPLLRHVAKWKASTRATMDAVEHPFDIGV